jgi:hypothetical protein
MVYTIYLWRFGGWFVIVVPALIKHGNANAGFHENIIKLSGPVSSTQNL